MGRTSDFDLFKKKEFFFFPFYILLTMHIAHTQSFKYHIDKIRKQGWRKHWLSKRGFLNIFPRKNNFLLYIKFIVIIIIHDSWCLLGLSPVGANHCTDWFLPHALVLCQVEQVLSTPVLDVVQSFSTRTTSSRFSIDLGEYCVLYEPIVV